MLISQYFTSSISLSVESSTSAGLLAISTLEAVASNAILGEVINIPSTSDIILVIKPWTNIVIVPSPSPFSAGSINSATAIGRSGMVAMGNELLERVESRLGYVKVAGGQSGDERAEIELGISEGEVGEDAREGGVPLATRGSGS
nr:hypothetical protein Iba_chr04aCG19390 [Ipomoea batatas]